jgi:hypothetical protein
MICMSDENQPDPSDKSPARGKPGRSRLRRILDERPEARPRLGRAIAILLGTGLVSLAAIGALSIWHLVRRGRLIRERLNAPHIVRMPELPGSEADSPS